MSIELGGPWVEWTGGTCPVDASRFVEVQFRHPVKVSKSLNPRVRPAGFVRWTWIGEAGDVVRYRLIDKMPELTEPKLTDYSQSPLQVQEGGSHYKDLKIQPVTYIHANGIGFCEGNVIKYVSRWRAKGGVQDLKKARHFLDLLIELEETQDGN